MTYICAYCGAEKPLRPEHTVMIDAAGVVMHGDVPRDGVNTFRWLKKYVMRDPRTNAVQCTEVVWRETGFDDGAAVSLGSTERFCTRDCWLQWQSREFNREFLNTFVGGPSAFNEAIRTATLASYGPVYRARLHDIDPQPFEPYPRYRKIAPLWLVRHRLAAGRRWHRVGSGR